MDAAQFATLLMTWWAAVIFPGPDMLMVLQLSLTRSRRDGVAAAAGVVTGIAVWVIAAFLGLSALLQAFPQLMVALQAAGGALLVYLGVTGLRAALTLRRSQPVPAPEISAPAVVGAGAGVGAEEQRPRTMRQATGRDSYRRGLITNLANPKALVFFGAIFTPFLTGTISVLQIVILMVLMLLMALGWFSFLAMVATHPVLGSRIDAAQSLLDILAGTLFAVIGAVFLITALLP